MPSYGLLTYLAWPEYNAGDYIQSLAAAQYLPRVDAYVNREKLSEYRGNPLKIILNGWFMHKPSNWPPSDHLHPLVTSFHLNAQVKESLLDRSGVDWFKRHEPVGCRDPYTYQLLSSAGISCYHSGCLTTTLENKFHYRTNDIYFVDVLFRVPGWSTTMRTPREMIKALISGDVLKMSRRQRTLKTLFTDDILNEAKSISHYHPARHSEKERFEVAEDFLKKYATARLVVTSRLHCALPCLAFGTPVLFVHSGFSHDYDSCRLQGVSDLFNTIFIDDNENVQTNFELKGKVDRDFSRTNPTTFTQHVATLRSVCETFIKNTAVNA